MNTKDLEVICLREIAWDPDFTQHPEMPMTVFWIWAIKWLRLYKMYNEKGTHLRMYTVKIMLEVVNKATIIRFNKNILFHSFYFIWTNM